MSAIHSIQFLYTISGFAVGLLVGLTGVGGGSLMTPLLILLFGMHPAAAVGTDLLYAAATKSAGSVVHGFNRTVDWRVVRRLAAGSVPMTIVSISVLSYLDINGPGTRQLIGWMLAFALLLTAVTLIFRNRIVARYAPIMGALPPNRIAVLTVIVGGVLGVLVSISSVGAGAIGVTALVLLYPTLPTARIVGSDIVHAVPLTLVAGVGHWFLGSVDWQVFTALILGSVPGILIGSYAASRFPETALRVVLALTLLAVATKLSFGLMPSSTNVVAVQTSAPH
ncbi:MAG: sulfite exporter TauE/SafE family protein [Xanthobacteraceae bacterium]|jgi:uncharacterized membrane protein YfcA